MCASLRRQRKIFHSRARSLKRCNVVRLHLQYIYKYTWHERLTGSRYHHKTWPLLYLFKYYAVMGVRALMHTQKRVLFTGKQRYWLGRVSRHRSTQRPPRDALRAVAARLLLITFQLTQIFLVAHKVNIH